MDDAGTMELVELDKMLDDSPLCCGFNKPCPKEVHWVWACPQCHTGHLFCNEHRADAISEMSGRKQVTFNHICGGFIGDYETWFACWRKI